MNQLDQIKQAKLDPAAFPDIHCGKCGNLYFYPVKRLKRVSALQSPTGRESIIWIDVFICTACNTVLGTDEQAQEAHSFIRGLLQGMFTQDVAFATRILYGGSVKPADIALFTRQMQGTDRNKGPAFFETGCHARHHALVSLIHQTEHKFLVIGLITELHLHRDLLQARQIPIQPGLHEFLLRVHDEGPAARDRLTQRPGGHQQESRAFGARYPHRVAAVQEAERAAR